MFYYRKAQNIFDFLYGKDNFHTATIYNNIGGAYEQKGDLVKAEELCNQALKIKIKFQGEDSESIGQVYMNLAKINLRKNNFAEGSLFYKKAYLIFKKLGGSYQNFDCINNLVLYCRSLFKLE